MINNLSTKFKVAPKHILHVEEYADNNGILKEKENVLLPFCKQQCFVSLKKEMDKAEADAKKPESTSWHDNEVEHLSSYYILIDWMTSGSNYGNYSKAKDTHGRTKAGSKLDVAVEIQQHIFDKNGEFVLLNNCMLHNNTHTFTYLSFCFTIIGKKKKAKAIMSKIASITTCLLYTSPSPRDRTRSRMPSSA